MWVHGDLASEVLSGLSFLLGSDDLGWLGGVLLSGLLGSEASCLCLSLEALAGELASAEGLGVWVELQHDSEILQWILLEGGVLVLSLLGTEVRLDLL